MNGETSDSVEGPPAGHAGAEAASVSFPAAGLVRQARRIADLSQRELARRTGVSPSTVGRIEAGTIMPTLPAFQRMLAVAGLRLVVVDGDGGPVDPAADVDDLRDGAGRRYPAHLDVIVDPSPEQWRGDPYGRAVPAVTYHHRARPAPGARHDPASGSSPKAEERPEYGPWPVGFRRRRKRRPDPRPR